MNTDNRNTAPQKTIPCKECENGYVDVIDYLKVNSATIDIPYKNVKCETCNGTGQIEIEDEDDTNI